MVNILRFKQLLVTTALLLASIPSFAYDFEVDGIYYNKLSENTVEVTCEKLNGDLSNSNYAGTIKIPSSIAVEGTTYNVTSIGKYAFYKCGDLVTINIPDGVTLIGNSAFEGCSGLTSIDIPDGVTAIGESAFCVCTSLTSIKIPNCLTSIGNHTFQSCHNLQSINIPNGVTSIGNYAFYDCTRLQSINIPDGVTTIGEYAFNGCDKLASIIIPSSTTSIGKWAFEFSNINKVYISSVEDWMNIKCEDYRWGLSNYSLIVNGLKLTDLVVPESITTIGKYAFYNCTSLETITLHKGVTTIVQNAFNGCKNVKKIVCQGDTPPACGAKALEGISRTDCTLYVPETSGSNYQNTAPWSEFTNIVGGGTDTPDTPSTCETPTISFDNDAKKLVFTSTTEGATYHCTITSDDMMSDKAIDSEATMTGIYNITVYASADGMYNSEKTTAKLCWVSAAIESDGILTAKADRGVIVSSNGNQINISGTISGEIIEVYNVGGSKLKSVNATGDNTTISGLQSGNVYIIKIGGTKVKVAM